ncbi:MAG: Uma2 family endonuclease [Dehalococcoidia bacterium]
MTTATESAPCTTPRRWKISVDLAEQMVRTGIVAEDEPIELVEGVFYERLPRGPWHDASVQILGDALRRRGSIVSIKNALRLNEFSAPEPDVALLTFREDYYRAGGAGPGDVLLVVEVSDSSADHDRDVKLPLYARAGIPEAWLVTREPAAIEAYRSPREGVYTEMRTYLRGDTISPMALPDVRIAVSAVTR